MFQQIESLDRRPHRPIERFGIWGLLLCIALIRLPFWPHTRALRDGIAYSIGALVTHVAHPPGSIGYCLLGGWVNHLVGRVETSFILINLIAGLMATYLCYRVALAARLPVIGALLAAGLYGLSVNTLTATLTIAPHLIEGAATFAAVLFGLRAVHRKHPLDAWACTLTVGLVGAMRPTATVFLLAVWIYCIWNASRGHSRVAAHVAVLAAIVATWSVANEHYMTLAGYGGTTYEKQVLTPAPYDYVSMDTHVQSTSMRHTFHMPAAEVLAWLEPRLHVRLLPHIPDWPVPSLSRAGRLAAQQFVKQGTFIIVSLPICLPLIAIGLLQAVRRRQRLLNWQTLDRRTWIVLACWFLPAALFFIVGHLGTLTYLQSNLGALAIAAAALMTHRRPMNGATSWSLSPLAVGFASVVLSAVIFAAARPIRTTDSRLNLLNVALLQYTGPAKSAGYGAARVSAALDEQAAVDRTADADYQAANSDAALIEAARKHHFEYFYPSPTATPPAHLPQ